MLSHRKVTVLPSGLLSRADAAIYLGRSPQTLAGWATAGRGPRSRNVGGRSFYSLEDLEAFVAVDMRRA